jgi:hypothetical protein
LERGGRLNFQNSNGLPITDFGNVEQKTDLRPIKAVVYSSVTKNLLSVTEMLIRLLGKEKVAEMYESPDLGGISAELSRFRHGMIEYKTCPVCKRESDIRLCKGRKGERCKETLVEVEMFATQARFLIEPERILQALNVPMQRLDGHPLSWYNKSRTFWRVGDILRVDVRDSHPLLPKRENEDYWKAFGADRCIELAEAYQYMGQDWYFGSLPSGVDTVEVKLVKWQECARFHNSSRWYRGPRLSNATVEKAEEDVPILSLDAGLSHGLDLSFVTHLFLLEPIDDAALLEQVTSRAHRLGATGPVTVETINTFYKLSEEMDAEMKRTAKKEEATQLLQDKERALKKIVCHYCYRQFDSYSSAEEHERTLCPLNPICKGVQDSFHLSSVYREIRPPPPVSAAQTATGNAPSSTCA